MIFSSPVFPFLLFFFYSFVIDIFSAYLAVDTATIDNA
jgi:hypothetical protein